MINDLMEDAELRMMGAVTALDDDLAGFRTGRASPRLLDQVHVELYGVVMEMRQVAVISVPEPQQLAIRPYDAKSIAAIERAILKSDLGLMPNNDGKVIRLNLPRLTEERRRELGRLVGRRIEEAKVSVRNVRRDVRKDMEKLEHDKEIPQDELYRALDELDKLTERYADEIEKLGEQKTAEIMEV